MKTATSNADRLDLRSRLGQGLMTGIARLPFLPNPREYCLTVSHERRFLWFRVLKNGSRTVLSHFRASGVRLDVAERPYSLRYAPGLYRGYFKFAFVRNPWDRLVSCWADKVVKQRGVLFDFSDAQVEHLSQFANFVEYVATLDVSACNYHLRAQCAMIDVNDLDYLGRMETFADDFRRVCDAVGVSCEHVGHPNRSPRTTYREYYDQALRDRVFDLYRKDVQVFGYEF